MAERVGFSRTMSSNAEENKTAPSTQTGAVSAPAGAAPGTLPAPAGQGNPPARPLTGLLKPYAPLSPRSRLHGRRQRTEPARSENHRARDRYVRRHPAGCRPARRRIPRRRSRNLCLQLPPERRSGVCVRARRARPADKDYREASDPGPGLHQPRRERGAPHQPDV